MVRPSSLVISEIAIIKENNKAKQQKSMNALRKCSNYKTKWMSWKERKRYWNLRIPYI